MLATRVGWIGLGLALVLVGCGEDSASSSVAGSSGAGAASSTTGSAGAGGMDPDPNPATAELIFPLGAGTTADGTLAVRGRASDVEGVDTVTVNGVQAALDGDVWTADVPLAWGTHPLSIEVVDEAGFVTTVERGSIERAPTLFPSGSSMAFVGEALFLVSSSSLVRVALDGSARSVVAETQEPDGVVHTALHSASNSLLVLRGGVLSTYAIDTGERRQLATSSTAPSDTSFEQAGGLVVDEANNRAIIVDNAMGHLVAVDLDSGAKSVFVPPFMAVFSTARAVTLDEAGARILIVDDLPADPNAQVLSYALSDGDRDVVSFGGEGELDLSRVRSITTDGTKLWAVDGASILMVDLANGQRSLLFRPSFGDPRYQHSDVVGLHDGQLFVASRTERTISVTEPLLIDLALVESNDFPKGQPRLYPGQGAAMRPDGLVYTGQLPLSIDLVTGTREALPIGELESRYGYVWDDATGFLWAFDYDGFFSAEVVRLDVANDDAWTSVANVGRAISLIHDEGRGRLLVPEEGSSGISEVMLADGATRSAFGVWNDLRGAALAPDGSVLYVIDTTPETASQWVELIAYAVDPDDGTRTELAVIDDFFPKVSKETWVPFVHEGSLVVGGDAIDLATGEIAAWTVLPDNGCGPTQPFFLEDAVVFHATRCLTDLTTGAQIVLAR